MNYPLSWGLSWQGHWNKTLQTLQVTEQEIQKIRLGESMALPTWTSAVNVSEPEEALNVQVLSRPREPLILDDNAIVTPPIKEVVQ